MSSKVNSKFTFTISYAKDKLMLLFLYKILLINNGNNNNGNNNNGNNNNGNNNNGNNNNGNNNNDDNNNQSILLFILILR